MYLSCCIKHELNLRNTSILEFPSFRVETNPDFTRRFRKMLKRYSFALILVFVGQYTLAQQRHDQNQYQYAMELYQQKAYKSARFEFANYLRQFEGQAQAPDAYYYMASAAVKAGQDDGEGLMQQFVNSYPNHPLGHVAFGELGDYYFDKANYIKSQKYYQKAGDLSWQQIFQLGYSQFTNGDKEQALKTFSKLENTYAEHEYDAAYFQGFILLEQQKYDQAGQYLRNAFESQRYKNPAMELYTSVLYQNKKYQELIDLVETELEGTKNAVVQNNLSDAYFVLENYPNAAKSYQNLLRQHSKKRTKTNYFRAGYSFYQIDNQDEAVNQFKRAAVTDDSVGAYASYYLGIIYAEKNNLSFAASSFGNTAKYQTALKEEATYAQGKVLVDDNKFTHAIEVLTGYQEQFPNGKYTLEVSELISTAYSMTDNYDLALEHIESLDRLTPSMKETYQRVSFLKGMQYFNGRKFAKSIEVFQNRWCTVQTKRPRSRLIIG